MCRLSLYGTSFRPRIMRVNRRWTRIQQQWADDVYRQMEHKQIVKCIKQNVR